jgi:hypothetical protein
MAVFPSCAQILQNPPKPGEGRAKEMKEKGLDLLRFSWWL